MKMSSRVEALEVRVGECRFENVHRLIQRVGQTRDEVLDAYGREKIEPDDRVILRRLIVPSPQGNAPPSGGNLTLGARV